MAKCPILIVEYFSIGTRKSKSLGSSPISMKYSNNFLETSLFVFILPSAAAAVFCRLSTWIREMLSILNANKSYTVQLLTVYRGNVRIAAGMRSSSKEQCQCLLSSEPTTVVVGGGFNFQTRLIIDFCQVYSADASDCLKCLSLLVPPDWWIHQFQGRWRVDINHAQKSPWLSLFLSVYLSFIPGFGWKRLIMNCLSWYQRDWDLYFLIG